MTLGRLMTPATFIGENPSVGQESSPVVFAALRRQRKPNTTRDSLSGGGDV
jgi:hypothetical protein